MPPINNPAKPPIPSDRAGVAPPVVLEATHVSALEFTSLNDLRANAWTEEAE